MTEANKEVKVEQKDNPRTYSYFTVTVASGKGRIRHYLVKGETISDVLSFAKTEINAPILSILVTEYYEYYDSTIKLIKEL